eukprot:1143662-Pelagomonas_calceolata.AAC.3
MEVSTSPKSEASKGEETYVGRKFRSFPYINEGKEATLVQDRMTTPPQLQRPNLAMARSSSVSAAISLTAGNLVSPTKTTNIIRPAELAAIAGAIAHSDSHIASNCLTSFHRIYQSWTTHPQKAGTRASQSTVGGTLPNQPRLEPYFLATSSPFLTSTKLGGF